MALLSTITGTENVSLTKINATINTVNLIGGGTTGQRLSKSSNSDFAFDYVNPELRTFTTSVIDLDTATIGVGYNLYCDNQYDYRGNQRIKVYSLTSPTKFIIGLIDGNSNTNAHYILESKTGTGSFSDGVVILYFAEDVIEQNYNDTSTVGAGNIVNSFTGCSGVSFSSINLNLHRIGNRVTVDGLVVFIPSSTTPTIRVNLKTAYTRDTSNQGSTGFFPFNLFNFTDTVFSAGYIEQYTNAIQFTKPTTYIIGKTYDAFFQISFNIQ